MVAATEGAEVGLLLVAEHVVVVLWNAKAAERVVGVVVHATAVWSALLIAASHAAHVAEWVGVLLLLVAKGVATRSHGVHIVVHSHRAHIARATATEVIIRS